MPSWHATLPCPTRIGFIRRSPSAAVLLALTPPRSRTAQRTPIAPRRKSFAAAQRANLAAQLSSERDVSLRTQAPSPQVHGASMPLRRHARPADGCRLADAHRRQGDIDAAIADFDRAIKIDPKKIDNLLGRGLAYLEKRDTEQRDPRFQPGDQPQSAPCRCDPEPGAGLSRRRRSQACGCRLWPADPAQSEGCAGLLSARPRRAGVAGLRPRARRFQSDDRDRRRECHGPLSAAGSCSTICANTNAPSANSITPSTPNRTTRRRSMSEAWPTRRSAKPGVRSRTSTRRSSSTAVSPRHSSIGAISTRATHQLRSGARRLQRGGRAQSEGCLLALQPRPDHAGAGPGRGGRA